MAYATRADLGRLGIRVAALANVADDDQDAALQAASDLADSFFRSRYDLPLTQWGDDLRRCVCAIAAFDCLVIRGFDPSRGNDAVVQLRYEQAMTWLRDVSAGRVAVTGGRTTPTPSSGAGARSATAPARVTSRRQRGW